MLKALYLSLEEPLQSRWGKPVQAFIFLTIIVNLIAMSFDTVAEYHAAYGQLFETIEAVTVSIFIVELLLRYLVIGQNAQYRGLRGRVRFTFTFYTLVDIVAILPFLLSAFGINSYFIRALRLFRVFKLFKAAKMSKFDRVVKQVWQEDREVFFIVFAFIGIILMMLTVLVYFAEHDAQPEVFSSIPQTLWWAVVTLTTVGYGDMYPITTFGRIVTTVITMLGIAFYAIPGSLFTAALIRRIDKDEEEEKINE